MKLLFRAVLCSAFLCGGALRGDAQTTTGGAGGAVDPWSFNTGITGSYEGNALFVGPEGDEEFSHSVQANIARNWALRRGSANLIAGANQYFYRESTSLNDLRYNVGGGLAHSITRRLTWSGSSVLTSGLARDSDVLTAAGLVLPSVETRTSSSSSILGYELSRQSRLVWSVQQSGVGFSSGLFRGGGQIGSSLAWTRQVGRSQTLGITQDYTRTWADGGPNDTNIHGLFGTWSRAAGSWTASANAGVRPFSVPEEDGYRFALGLSGGITKPVRPGQVMGITYERSVTPSYGLTTGNHLLQSVTASYGVTLSRKLSTTFGGSYLRSSEPTLPDVNSTGQTATASLVYRLTTRIGLAFSTSAYSRTFPGEARVTSYYMQTGLTYGLTWH